MDSDDAVPLREEEPDQRPGIARRPERCSRLRKYRNGIILGVAGLLAFLLVVVLFVVLGQDQSGSSPATSQPVAVIFDTDMAFDVDDVGALAVLNALVDLGEAEFVAIVHDTGLPEGIGAVSSIMNYYCRNNVPLGAFKGSFLADRPGPYVHDLVATLPGPVLNYTQVPSGVDVYRKELSARADGSVVIVSVGFVTNLAELLMSGPDAFSQLTGKQLVAQKVSRIVWMGGEYPASMELAEFNFGYGGIGNVTRFVIDNWPETVPIIFSGFEIGLAIFCGGGLTNYTPAASPVRRAYTEYVGPSTPREAWDPVTVLQAVRGIGTFWTLHANGSNLVDADGNNTWVGSPVRLQSYQVQRSAPSAVGAALDTLLLMTPRACHRRA